MLEKQKTYIDDLASDDECIMEKNEANSSLDASDEDILVEVREDEDASKGGVVAPMYDLEVPPIVDNDEGHGEEDINENEDHVEEEDDYPAFNEGFPWIVCLY